MKSIFQEDSTNIATIETKSSKSDSLRIIFVLPVEEQKEIYKYGSGIKEIKDLKEFRPEIFAGSFPVNTAQLLGIRESRIIEGDYKLSLKDWVNR